MEESQCFYTCPPKIMLNEGMLIKIMQKVVNNQREII